MGPYQLGDIGKCPESHLAGQPALFARDVVFFQPSIRIAIDGRDGGVSVATIDSLGGSAGKLGYDAHNFIDGERKHRKALGVSTSHGPKQA